MLLARWYPVTQDVGFLQAPVKQVVAAFLEWHGSLGVTYSRRDITSSLADAFDALSPLSKDKRRRLFVDTPVGWTACFQSGIDGSDPFPATSHLAEEILRVLGMRVCATPPGARWSATIWEVYAPARLGDDQTFGHPRTICAANDGGSWVFEQSGAPFPFERLERYSLTRKRDRFTRELLVEYLNHYGLEPFNDAFYLVSPERPAVVLERKTRWTAPTPEFTLDEVVKGLPWKR